MTIPPPAQFRSRAPSPLQEPTCAIILRTQSFKFSSSSCAVPKHKNLKSGRELCAIQCMRIPCISMRLCFMHNAGGPERGARRQWMIGSPMIEALHLPMLTPSFASARPCPYWPQHASSVIISHVSSCTCEFQVVRHANCKSKGVIHLTIPFIPLCL